MGDAFTTYCRRLGFHEGRYPADDQEYSVFPTQLPIMVLSAAMDKKRILRVKYDNKSHVA